MAVVAAVLVALLSWGAEDASAADLHPCVAVAPTTQPAGPIVEIDGEINLVLGAKSRRAFKGAGVRQRLIAPAESSTGRPAFPVTGVEYGDDVSRLGLSGGLRLLGKGRKRLEFRSFAVTVRASGQAWVNARFAGGSKRFLNIKGAKLRRDTASGELYLQSGSARLSSAASKAIGNRFGLRKSKAMKTGATWGVLDAYALRRVTNSPPTDPEAETPVEPPVATRPAGAVDLTAATVSWRIRDSFIRYVSSGDGVSAVDGAIAGPAEEVGGPPPLVYEFGFPFSSGWTDPGTQSSLIEGTGGVAFRHCQNTINFVVHDPEIELNGDLSRMIFRVQGTDGTAFPNSRAVMVGLRLSQAESVTTVGNTTTYEDIPGYVPEGSAGIFADFYMPGDEFGSLTLSLTTP